jgi:hypothetical protein
MANVLRYTSISTAPQLDLQRSLFLATVGTRNDAVQSLANLDAGLVQSIAVADAVLGRVPPVPAAGSTLKAQIAAGRRVLLSTRSTARRADLASARASVNALQAVL